MIERLVSTECADRPTLQRMSNFDLKEFYHSTAAYRERHRALQLRADRRIKRLKKEKEDIQRLWEWSCAWIKRTRLPKEQYPFPSREVAAWLIKIKEKVNEEARENIRH